MPSLDDILAEEERRLCIPNKYTGVAPLLVKVNGKYRRIIPKFQDLFTIAGVSGDRDLTEGYDFFPLEGGRAGGKSESLAHLLVEISEVESAVCLCTREVQNSISESVYAYIKEWCVDLGYYDHFKFLQDKIVNEKTGFTFIFKGMQTGTKKDSIKSIKNAKYVWCEEAQSLTHESIKMLLPTVRVEGRKLFFSYNRKTEHDAIVSLRKRAKTWLTVINYYDNPFLPRNLWDQAQEDKLLDEDDYLHVWEGQPLKDDPALLLLPYSWLIKCVGAHTKIGYEAVGAVVGGVDVAEGKTDKHDKNSLAIRQGPVVRHKREWRCEHMYESIGVLKEEYYNHGFEKAFFDGVGVGSAISSEASRIKNTEESQLPFDLLPFKGSTKVYGGDTVFSKHGSHIIYNKDKFKNAKSQQWENLRMRAKNTLLLLEGKKIDREDYFLSFDGTEDEWKDAFIEMSQATYKTDASGRKMIDKTPSTRTIIVDGREQQVKSPNIADSIGYSFVDDFSNGLREHVDKAVEKDEYVMPVMSTSCF